MAACAFLPPGQGGSGVGKPPPVPEVVRSYPWMADVRWPGTVSRPSAKDEMAAAEDIDGLLTGDFDVYPVAARRLIGRGDRVLPYVGHAAERHPAPAARKERLAIVLRPVLRDTSEERVLAALASPYAAVRAVAAASAGDRLLQPLGLRLIELLEDPDISVRRAAIASLRRLTGEFLEYRADDPPARRAADAARWYAFWNSR